MQWICIKGKNNVQIPRQAISALLKQGNCLGACGVVENLTNSTITGRQGNSQTGMEAYPNPVTDQLYISLGTNELYIHTIEIQDLLTARTLVQVPVNGASSMLIPPGNLKPGI